MRVPRLLRTVALLALAGAGSAGLYRAGGELLKEDTFAALRAPSDPSLSEDTGIRFGPSSFRHYRGGVLVARATVGRAEVSKDRSRFDFAVVRKGWFRSARGPLQFEAARGGYNEPMHALTIEGGATAKNPDLDVATDRLVFDSRGRIVVFPKPLSGRVGQGYGRVADLRYALDDGAWTSGAGRWEGTLALAQEGETRGPRRWTLNAQTTRNGGAGRPNVQVAVNATATDKEVFVRAPLVERDLKTNVIVASGRVFYYSADVNLVADKVTVYQDERRAVAVGNVLLLVKEKKTGPKGAPNPAEKIPDLPPDPGPVVPGKDYGPTAEEKALDRSLRSGKSLREFPLQIAMGKTVYWYRKGERRAILEGFPKAYQDLPGKRWRRMNATTGAYDGENDKLTLRATPGKVDVRMRNSLGDDFLTDWLTTSTKEGDDDVATGVMKGDVYAAPDDDEKKPPPRTAS